MTLMSQMPQLLAADLEPYKPPEEANNILNWLAWGASAAGVAGFIFIGTQMSLQLRRGEMGEGATYFRSFFIVLLASIVSTAAGPIVSFFGFTV